MRDLSRCLSVAFVALVGCSDDTASITLGTSSQTLQVAEREAKEFTVQVNGAGTPMVGAVVSFAVEGTANGATVSSAQAVADATGIARNTIQAGSVAQFAIVAMADGAAPLRIAVEVTQSQGGSLEVTLTDNSAPTSDKVASVSLIQSTPCLTFDPRALPPPITTVANAAQTVTVAPTATVVFNGLTPGLSYGVVAVMVATVDGGTVPVAKGCAENLVVSATGTTRASIWIEDFVEPL